MVPDKSHFPQNSVVLCKSTQWQIDKIITVENEYSYHKLANKKKAITWRAFIKRVVVFIG